MGNNRRFPFLSIPKVTFSPSLSVYSEAQLNTLGGFISLMREHEENRRSERTCSQRSLLHHVRVSHWRVGWDTSSIRT